MRLRVFAMLRAGLGMTMAGLLPTLSGCDSGQQQAQVQPTPPLAEREKAILSDPRISAAQKQARLKIERAKDRDAAAREARFKSSTP